MGNYLSKIGTAYDPMGFWSPIKMTLRDAQPVEKQCFGQYSIGNLIYSTIKSYRPAGRRGQDDINCTDDYGVLVREVHLYLPKVFRFSTIIGYFRGSHILPIFYATNRIYSQLAERWASTKDRLGNNLSSELARG